MIPNLPPPIVSPPQNPVEKTGGTALCKNRLMEDHNGNLYLEPKPIGYIIGEQIVRPIIDLLAHAWSHFTPSTLFGRFISLPTLLLQNMVVLKQGISKPAALALNLLQLSLMAQAEEYDNNYAEASAKDIETEQEINFIFPSTDHHPVQNAKLTLDQGLFLNQEGQALFSKKMYKEAAEKFQKALTIFDALNQNDLTVGACLTNLGLCYLYLQNFERAIEKLNRSIEIKKNYKEDILVANSLSNLALCFHSQGKNVEALNKYEEATKIKRKILKSNDPNIAVALRNEANILCILDRYREALKKYEEAAQIFSSNKDQQGLAENQRNHMMCQQKFKKF